MKNERIDKVITLILKALNIVSTATCVICILGGVIVSIAGVVVCIMARDDRDAALDFCSSVNLIVRLEDDLTNETISIGSIADEPPQTLRTYQFADGEVVTVSESDIRRDLQYKQNDRKFIATLNGTDIKRRHNVSTDGIEGMQYKLNSVAIYTLPNGRTVQYDQVVWIADAATNDRISADYTQIKASGAIVLMALLLSVVGIILCGVVLVVKKIIKEIYQLSSDFTPKKKQHKILVTVNDSDGNRHPICPIIEQVSDNEYRVQATIPIYVVGSYGEEQVVESECDVKVVIADSE